MQERDRENSGRREQVLERVQVNIPFGMLMEAYYQELVLSTPINPEIGLDAGVLDTYTKADFADVAEKLHQRGCSVTIHGPFLDLSPGSPDTAIRNTSLQRFRQMLQAVEVFRPAVVVCHAAYDASRYDFCREQWIANSIDTWQWLAAAVQERGARLMLENVYERDPSELLAVLKRFSPELLGCCLDVGHQAVFSAVALGEWFERLRPYIGQLHLHDNHGDFDAHLGMGRGSIDFRPLFDFLTACRSSPVLTLEPHYQEDFEISMAYLEQYLPLGA
ncbi:MAG TPA: sugar phosphate isomerase/epimerase family protein [Desulfosalsimonadaceae bacterium]|nr:sugar phosphate isomerase/epimerase family protein [Desulfosalsimonadaceae bacterium]